VRWLEASTVRRLYASGLGSWVRSGIKDLRDVDVLAPEARRARYNTWTLLLCKPTDPSE